MAFSTKLIVSPTYNPATVLVFARFSYSSCDSRKKSRWIVRLFPTGKIERSLNERKTKQTSKPIEISEKLNYQR